MARKPVITLAEPGTLLARFTVPGRAVPWKAPTYASHGTFKDKRLKSWQDWVWAHALKSYRGDIYEGPVGVVISAWIKRTAGAAPDVTNIQKAIEDAIQNVVIANDRQVRAISSELHFDPDERVTITVYALGA